ncbi:MULTISPECIES: two-component system sensor histidine kinase PgtB [Edwardsiella]|uniref:C4-dicarboxylate transport sensor protein DctB n=2 Tax=Edwardsiella anguillarum TaxID=1821960 RepID=A0A076LT82_9GAMM|nr:MULTISPECIES: ATP-binding protein [Edwardsiella]AKM48172.1 histidine kinase [Edwardsiella sp. EA181011]GAJ66617.1 phosphoglycerate transport system sensor protein PgtB [Edwardsiella piscicida]AIJ09718.1 Phosphoglycerate transport system sensor protein PgtB [Edwardsiella anguillarum ET080813]KAB0592662.1 HAMP domain-containing protein [Edwardsiella anguillarum]RFT04000.1 sensor histidine kinase [Edwardsiella anguillarum]
MKRLLRQARRLSISASLQIAFLASALLTLFVSAVSLYSWHAQSSQVRYTLDDYFPRIQSSLVIENALNTLVDQLNEFVLAPDTSVRLQFRQQIVSHLTQIEQLSHRLEPGERHQLAGILQQSRQLLSTLDNALYTLFLAREKTNEVAGRITWLHDDFTTELNSLMQDFSWQQGALIDQMEGRDAATMHRLQQRLRAVQQEQQQVYALARLENQITNDLRDRIGELNNSDNGAINMDGHRRYLEYLRNSAAEIMQPLTALPSTVTLRQTIDELLDIGLGAGKLPATLADYQQARNALLLATQQKERTLSRFRAVLEQQLDTSHRRMQTFNQRLEHIIRVSGRLILIATLLSLLLALLLSYGFIRSRLVKRFTALSQAVARIGTGDRTTRIPVYGVDELGRIARLLRRTLSQQHRQQRRLEREVAERKAIEHHLRTTQDELIQAAKLAVVGQTMTTLAHEINQPLNALSMYLFSARRALESGQQAQAEATLQKCDGLIGRMDAIIRSLRQFARRADDSPLHPLALRQAWLSAWELLAPRHRRLQARLTLPADDVWIRADDVRLQQVLVNLLTNALDAAEQPMHIAVNWRRHAGHLEVTLCDDGPGWPLALAHRLLKPFTTSKQVGLGIGLSISQSLMEQLGGELRIASALPHGACILLCFTLADAPPHLTETLNADQ